MVHEDSSDFFTCVFQMTCSNVRYGKGVTREIGMVIILFHTNKSKHELLVSNYWHQNGHKDRICNLYQVVIYMDFTFVK